MDIECFRDLPLSKEVMKGIEELGFDNLFPIQAQAMSPLLEGKDVIGQAETGTGKTAAFGIPMVERIDRRVKHLQGLVLVPTRELAVQVAEDISRFGKYLGIRALAVYGGEPVRRQLQALKHGVRVVVGTPGRTIDLFKRNALDLQAVRIVVLDEADKMLDMGFIADIEYILDKVPSNRQMSLFSATIDERVMRISTRYLKRPRKILVSKDEIALTQIKQYYILADPISKFETLCSILDRQHIKRAIVFCNRRTGTSVLASKLTNRGYDACALHAGLTQPRRDVVVNSFRNRRLRLLVATDVAARGLDIQGITHIINYDVPVDALVYFHRIGRTARMGGEGTAITLVGHRELAGLGRIRAMTKTAICEMGMK